MYTHLLGKFWGADLADMQLVSKFNKQTIYSKYARVVPLKDKKGITITNVFQKNLDEPNHKPKKYGLIKEVRFAVDQNHGYKKII